MSLYDKLAQNKFCLSVVRKTRSIYNDNRKKKRVKGKYNFINRSRNCDKLCIILAGYKEFLWDDVFGRIKKYVSEDIDVCIVSSGLYSKKLESIALENSWSYLSVKQNKVTLVQNIAIDLFREAKMIYKLDEDMFVTSNFFSQLMETYTKVKENDNYKIGFVAPLIPINGFSNVTVLKKTNTLKSYEKKFGKAYHDGGGDEPIIKNPDIARFMWGESEKVLRDIDKLADMFSNEEFSYDICSIRFSIGAILFSRDLWEEMGRFEVGLGNNMGVDEVQMCRHCMLFSRAIVVAENTIVGHFSYGPQTKTMIDYYNDNRKIFKVK